MPTSRRQVVLFVSLLLTFALGLSACGNNEPEPTATPVAVVEATPTIAAVANTPAVSTPVVEATPTEAATAPVEPSDVLTETVDTEAGDTEAVDSSAVSTDTLSGDVEIMTDTQVITGTEVLTAMEVTTDVVVLEQQLVTTVVTSTDLVTDVTTLSDQTLITETDSITETENVSPTTQTEGAVGGASVVQITATPAVTVTTQPMTGTAAVTDTITASATPQAPATDIVTGTGTVTGTGAVTGTGTVTGAITGTSAVTDTDVITGTGAVTGTDVITGTGVVTDTGEASAAETFVGVVGAQNRIVRASELLGANVNDFNQEDVGQLSDLIVNLTNGRIVFATLGSGGFLGLGEEIYPVPLSAFRYLPDTNELALNIDEAQLTNTPGFSGDWPDVTNPRYDVEVENFWRNLGANVVPNRMVTGVRSVSGTVARASNLLNSSVYNPEGEELGNINDMLIDLGSGEVRYVVLSFGGFLGIGAELRAIPLSAFDLDTRGVFDDTAAATLILGTDRTVLEQAPAFDANAYPDTATPDWDATWRQFWNDNL